MRFEHLGEFERSLLLAIAHLGDNAYGVTIRREIETRTRVDVAIGAIYTSLNRLERKRFVTSTVSDPLPQRGGRPRRLFLITRAGAEALRQSHVRWTRMWKGLPPTLRHLP